MDQISMTDSIHARRIRILKESEETLGKHVESRDNTTIVEFLDNVKDIENRTHLFQSAVLKLTCNNDRDTLGAVLDYGKEKNLGVQWIKVEEGKEKNPDFQWMRDEGRRNPIIVASEQASIIYIRVYNCKYIFSRASFSALTCFTSLDSGFPKFNPTHPPLWLGSRNKFAPIWWYRTKDRTIRSEATKSNFGSIR